MLSGRNALNVMDVVRSQRVLPAGARMHRLRVPRERHWALGPAPDPSPEVELPQNIPFGGPGRVELVVSVRQRRVVAFAVEVRITKGQKIGTMRNSKSDIMSTCQDIRDRGP